MAYVVGNASAAELDGLCLQRIARFKRPKDYVFVPALLVRFKARIQESCSEESRP